MRKRRAPLKSENSIVEFFRNSPLAGVELDLARSRHSSQAIVDGPPAVTR